MRMHLKKQILLIASSVIYIFIIETHTQVPQTQLGVPQSQPGGTISSPRYPLAGTGVSLRKGPGARDQGKNMGLGTPPERTWHQRPGKEHGTGVLPQKGLGTKDLGKNLGLVLPPVDRHTPVKQYLPHPSDAGGNYS